MSAKKTLKNAPSDKELLQMDPKTMSKAQL